MIDHKIEIIKNFLQLLDYDCRKITLNTYLSICDKIFVQIEMTSKSVDEFMTFISSSPNRWVYQKKERGLLYINYLQYTQLKQFISWYDSYGFYHQLYSDTKEVDVSQYSNMVKEITELEYSIINYRKKIARLTKRNITLLDSVDEISAKIEIDNSIGNLNIKITPNHVLMKLGNFNYICDKTSALYNALLKEQIKSFNYVWFEEMFIFIKVGSNSYNKEGVLCDEETMIARIKKSYYYDQQNRKERGQKEAKDRQIWYRHFDGQERIINPNSTDYLDTKDLM